MDYSIADLLRSILNITAPDELPVPTRSDPDTLNRERRAFGSAMASGVIYPPAIQPAELVVTDPVRDAPNLPNTRFLEPSSFPWGHQDHLQSTVPQDTVIYISHPDSHHSNHRVASGVSTSSYTSGVQALRSHLRMPDRSSAGSSSKKPPNRPLSSQGDAFSSQDSGRGGGATISDNLAAPSLPSSTRRPGTGSQTRSPSSLPPPHIYSQHPSQAQPPSNFYHTQDYTRPSAPPYMTSHYSHAGMHPQYSPHALSHQHQQQVAYTPNPYGLTQSPGPPMVSHHHSFQQPYGHHSGMNTPENYGSLMAHVPWNNQGHYPQHSVPSDPSPTALEHVRSSSPSGRVLNAPMATPHGAFQSQSSNPATGNPINSPHGPPGSTGYYTSPASQTYAPFFPYHLASSPAQTSPTFSPYGHGSYGVGYGPQHSPEESAPGPHQGQPAQWWYTQAQSQQSGGTSSGSPYDYAGTYMRYSMDGNGGMVMSPGMVPMHQMPPPGNSGRPQHLQPMGYPPPRAISHAHSPVGSFPHDSGGGHRGSEQHYMPSAGSLTTGLIEPDKGAGGEESQRHSSGEKDRLPARAEEQGLTESQSATSTSQGHLQLPRTQGQRRSARQQQAPQKQQPTPPTSSGSKKGRATSPVRKPYHPNPPTQRSEWVMWVGNVPADATREELWKFFNNSSGSPGISGSASSGSRLTNVEGDGGVSSVFLISQSNCAFINFDTNANLDRAISRFNGKPLRSTNPRCPKLVCRIRRKDDDLRAGVGAQRGMGMHMQWIKAQLEEMRRSRAEGELKDDQYSDENTDSGDEGINVPAHLLSHDAPPTSPSTHLGQESESGQTPPLTQGVVDGRKVKPSLTRLDATSLQIQGRKPSSSSSGSFASTTSSFLTQHFPQRYFILKSLTEADLYMSVERGVWATQPHNEPVLDQAYRTSSDVFLIFGANKTGEFFGYARMTGPIQKGERHLTWSSIDSSSSRGQGSPSASRSHQAYEAIVEEPPEDRDHPDGTDPLGQTQSPSPMSAKAPGTTNTLRILDDKPYHFSPAQMAPGEGTSIPLPVHRPQKDTYSAPAILGPPPKKVTLPDSTLGAGTLDPRDLRSNDIVLDPKAPILAIRNPLERAKALSQEESVSAEEMKQRSLNEGSSLAKAVLLAQSGREGKQGSQDPALSDTLSGESWGTPFSIQWIKTERLPFNRTKHLRNRWNYDKEIKVSRDGTELEPSVGRLLLQEWERLNEEPTTRGVPSSRPERGGRGYSTVR